MKPARSPRRFPGKSEVVTTRLIRPTPAAIRRLAKTLRNGGLVAVPTETVYGLAADALNADACARIFLAKGRPATDPLIVHVPNRRAAEAVAVFNDAAKALAKAFWPGPLTLVLPKQAVIPDIVTSGLPSVAVRLPRHPIFLALLRATGRPLAAPSANPFGYISPTTAQHVLDSLGGIIGDVLDGGSCAMGVESTIVDLRDPQRPRVLRPGPITAEEIEAVLRIRVLASPKKKSLQKTKAPQPAAEQTAQVAPGLLTRHYSPRTPLRLVKKIRSKLAAPSSAKSGRVAWLYFKKPLRKSGSQTTAAEDVFWLSVSGNIAEASRNVFNLLRTLDRAGYKEIVAESAPVSPKSRALNDRLQRAAARA